MPKIRVLGGFTDATARAFVSPADELRARGKLGPYDDESAKRLVDAGLDPDDVAEAVAEGREADLLKEDPWPGNSSETSPEKPPKTDEPAKPNRRKHARTTGNRSRQGRAGSSSASSTGGSGRGTKS